MKPTIILVIILALAGTASAQLSSQPSKKATTKKAAATEKKTTASDSVGVVNKNEGTGFRVAEIKKTPGEKPVAQKGGFLPNPGKEKSTFGDASKKPKKKG